MSQANQLAAAEAPLPPNVRITVRRGVRVEELRGLQGGEGQAGELVRVVGQSEAGRFDLQVEIAVAHVGFRPDLSLSRELQATHAPRPCTSPLHPPLHLPCPPPLHLAPAQP